MIFARAMPWLRFTARFDWSPARLKGRVTVSYPAGLVQFVTRECAGVAIAAGKAQLCRRPLESAHE